ncbi:hypothetical protein LSH36_645g01070 [Paralvinella palmiformis]|uniref:Uncharacterized protein n=1 Tax=Paralvinella palmiformis TaxID=53620 RepID=A0AAD9MUI1_9ANNE|nr:hypothetical protein LSH36_645g01070 [Paralvinella palmiformis]
MTLLTHRTGPDTVTELVTKYSRLVVKEERNNDGVEETVLYCNLCQKQIVNTGNGKRTWNTGGYRLLRK